MIDIIFTYTRLGNIFWAKNKYLRFLMSRIFDLIDFKKFTSVHDEDLLQILAQNRRKITPLCAFAYCLR